MNVNELNIAEIEATPPPLELSPEEITELAEELVEYHEHFAEEYYRVEQAKWGCKYLQGLMLPIKRKSIQPMAQALMPQSGYRHYHLWNALAHLRHWLR
jgi:SRSO17 transposase